VTTVYARNAAPPPRTVGLESHARQGEYGEVVTRLNRASVKKYYRAYTDVAWDDYPIDPADPRWIPRSATPVHTEWFRSLPLARQARLCLHMSATLMKLGAQFENVVCRGLLEFAATLPNNSPDFRYAYHEVIEESNHSLMFQEFVNRSGLDVHGLSPGVQRRGARIARLGRTFPELFFIFVLAGEEPIDYQQRALILEPSADIHPLLRRVSQIHVTEETRHISFARALLRKRVPALSRLKMARLRVAAPMIVSFMVRTMMQPSAQLIREYQIPRGALAQAFDQNPVHHQHVLRAVSEIVELCREVGVLAPPYDWLWRRAGLIPKSGPPRLR
jgi:hypothetical protein